MAQLALAETTEFYSVDAGLRLDPERRSVLGQFMTPAPIGRFMASLFSDLSGDTHVLDPGAGVGSLTAALVERLCKASDKPRSAKFTCYEIDQMLIDYLLNTLTEASAQCERAQFPLQTAVLEEDFILAKASRLEKFTHIIMNPPYKKIPSASQHRAALRRAGIETSNLYTGFMFLAALQLESGGEMVAIIPRSFCNGPYFKPFREQFFSMMALRQIHIFEKRNSAFKGDDVLQENIILHAVKDGHRGNVKISSSRDGAFELAKSSGECFARDMTQRSVPYASVISKSDPHTFVRIATDDMEQSIAERMDQFTATLKDIGVSVSTGPVVDFRLKADLRADPEAGAAPLLYAQHFQGGVVKWPKATKKPNAIQVSTDSRKWLWQNEGHFVVTRRFTTKEERRRIVASVYASDLPGELIGFENHLNVFHCNQKGLSPDLAKGLHIFLNSTLVDRFFRQFNGHTQVNATDLRSLRYPDRAVLERIGRDANDTPLTQQKIDTIIDGELHKMADETNPLHAQQKIEDALKILKAIGMPKGQQNERSALTLLALLNLTASGSWDQLERPLLGITPIMEFTKQQYGREYAPNTREAFRRQTMHQFVEAGVALYNPDAPSRPVNSPNACYQISEGTLRVIGAFGTKQWDTVLQAYLETQKPLAEKWAQHREMQMIPVRVANDKEITLTPGAHSELIKQIITEFAPRFAPGAEVIYVGDTGNKQRYFEEERLAALGVTVDPHGKMPDVVLYFPKKGWLLLIESVTSHGPVDSKRHNELATLFKSSQPALVYVTAFPDRGIMGRYLGEISWETEVWCADAPTHLIHFNGERFLGPYETS